MLVPKKKFVIVSVSTFLLLSLSGCSDFISPKTTPIDNMQTPPQSQPVPSNTPSDVPELEIPIESITPIPIPPEDIEPPEAATEAPPEFSQPVETAPATPVPEAYLPDSYADANTNDESTVRLRAGDTLVKVAAIATSPSYQKLVQEAEAVIPADNEPGSPKLRAVIADNETAMDEIHQVFTFSDTGLVKIGAVSVAASPQVKDSMRDIVVLNRFMAITRQLEGKIGFMEVSPGAIIHKDSEWQFKSDDSAPKATVVLKGQGSNDYHYIQGFEGFRLDAGGKRFVMAG